MSRGAAAIAAGGGASAALGVLYWVLAARLYPASVVGRNSSLIAAMTTIAGLSQLNYARSLSGLLPHAGGHAKALLFRVYAMTAGASVILGGGYVVIAPALDHKLAFVQQPWWLALLFVLAAPLWIVFTLEDTALASLRRADVIPVENTAYGLLKIAALYVLWVTGAGEWAMFLSWTLPLLFCVVPVNVLLVRKVLTRLTREVAERPRATPRWVVLDAVGYMVATLGTLPLPIFVLAISGPSAAAVVYIPLTIVTALDALTLSIGNTLTAELTQHSSSVPAARALIRRTCLLLGVLALLVAAGAPVLLRLFGSSYAGDGSLLLALFMLAAVPRALTIFTVAVLRAHHAGAAILAYSASGAIITLGLVLPLLHAFGVTGLGVGWLLANVAVGAVAVRTLVRAIEPGWSGGPARS